MPSSRRYLLFLERFFSNVCFSVIIIPSKPPLTLNKFDNLDKLIIISDFKKNVYGIYLINISNGS